MGPKNVDLMHTETKSIWTCIFRPLQEREGWQFFLRIVTGYKMWISCQCWVQTTTNAVVSLNLTKVKRNQTNQNSLEYHGHSFMGQEDILVVILWSWEHQSKFTVKFFQTEPCNSESTTWFDVIKNYSHSFPHTEDSLITLGNFWSPLL